MGNKATVEELRQSVRNNAMVEQLRQSVRIIQWLMGSVSKMVDGLKSCHPQPLRTVSTPPTVGVQQNALSS